MATIKIRNFQDFINENYTDKVEKIYMLVKKPFPTDSENPLGRMIGEVREVLFDQVIIDDKNWKSLKFEKNVPVINFTEDLDLVKNLLDKKIIAKKNLYNHPDESSLVSDKKIFHETFQGSKYVPLTVFSSKDTSKLKFPIIAKPAHGKSAEGIMKINSSEELEKTNEKFDVFSEMIDIKNEYRCFCFEDEILELNQRIKLKDSEDFLKNADTKTDFYYKQVDHKKFKNRESLEDLLKECRKKVKLNFYSVDVAETLEGELFIIEMNSRTGMGVDKMIEIYKKIYEDYYGKKISSASEKEMKKFSKEWKDLYDKEKGSRIDECTTVVGNLDGTMFLFKNRDRSFTPESEIVREKIDGTEIVYYTDQTGWIEGMNEHGIGFVFSQLTSKEYKGYGPSYIISDEPKNSTRFLKFQKGIKKVLSSKTLDDAIKNLEESKKSGSFLIADKQTAYEIEFFEGNFKKRKLDLKDSPFYVKTNHGELIPNAGHQESPDSIKRASSQIRKHQAYVQLQGINDLSDIPSRMKFQAFDPESSLNVFRTDREEYTISQCMMDLSNLKFYFFHDDLTANSIKTVDSEGKIVIDTRKVGWQ